MVLHRPVVIAEGGDKRVERRGGDLVLVVNGSDDGVITCTRLRMLMASHGWRLVVTERELEDICGRP